MNQPDKNLDQKLILASQSPRRKELLTAAGYQFEVDAPHDSVEQGVCSKCSPEQLVLESAFAKAKAIAQKHATGLVLAADTVAVCGSETLGKPVDRQHAERMLKTMRGTKHRVLTGVCLWLRPQDVFETHLEATVLEMDELSDDQVDSFLETDEWIGKAGAFGYQDGLDWVHVIEGLESNVVGLPVERLDDWIEQLSKKVQST